MRILLLPETITCKISFEKKNKFKNPEGGLPVPSVPTPRFLIQVPPTLAPILLFLKGTSGSKIFSLSSSGFGKIDRNRLSLPSPFGIAPDPWFKSSLYCNSQRGFYMIFKHRFRKIKFYIKVKY